MGVGVSVGGQVPPLDVQFAQLTDDARVAHHHHGPGDHEIQNGRSIVNWYPCGKNS